MVSMKRCTTPQFASTILLWTCLIVHLNQVDAFTTSSSTNYAPGTKLHSSSRSNSNRHSKWDPIRTNTPISYQSNINSQRRRRSHMILSLSSSTGDGSSSSGTSFIRLFEFVYCSRYKQVLTATRLCVIGLCVDGGIESVAITIDCVWPFLERLPHTNTLFLYSLSIRLILQSMYQTISIAYRQYDLIVQYMD